MKAPCCLLGAAALPRPPEGGAKGSFRCRWAFPRSSRFPYTYIFSVWWVIVVLMTSSARGECPIRTDALDIESRAFVAPQVVEAVVQVISVVGHGDRVGGGGGGGNGGGGGGAGAVKRPGQPYSVTVSVSRVLRRYRGPFRVKKRSSLTLTFRHPSLESDSENDNSGLVDEDVEGAGETSCLVTADLRTGRKYLFFLSGAAGGRRGPSASSPPKGPLPVALPEPANKKVRRVVRKMVCKKCGGPPTVSGLRDDSVVRDYNLTLECTAQGSPTPTVHWYKDDVLLTPSRTIKIKTRKLRRKMGLRSRGTRMPRQSPNPFLSEGIGGRRRIIRRRRGGGGGGGGGVVRRSGGVFGEMQRDEEVRGAAGIEQKRRTRGGRRREGGERKRLTGRRRVAGDEEDEDEGGGGVGAGAGGSEGPRKVMEGRRRRLRGRSHGRSGNANSQRHKSGGATSSSSSSGPRSASSTSSSTDRQTAGSSGSSSGRRHPSSSSRRTGKMITSTLVVREVSEDDAGVYKCMAKSVAGEATSQARIRVVPPIFSPSIDPHPFVDKCPIAGYCLNGGTCMMFKIVGELVCQCAEGFKGQRCQEKEVYPTFRRDCHGPLRHIRHSRGLRCPRNQPTALWELLQQALARGQKGPAWTKNHFLDWSPILTEHAYWPRYMALAPHSSNVPHHKAHRNGAPVHSKLHPTLGTLPQNASKEAQHEHQIIQNPMLLDSLTTDLNHSRNLEQERHQESHLKDHSSLVLQHQTYTSSQKIMNPLSTFMTPVERRVRPDGPINEQRDLLLGLFSAQPHGYREDELVGPTHHHGQDSHHKHRQRHSSHNTNPPLLDINEDTYTTQSTRLEWDQTEAEVRLSSSSQMAASSLPPQYLNTPNQNNLQQ